MIVYYDEPFAHAIVYDHFDEIELNDIKEEIKTLQSVKESNKLYVNDDHHKKLLHNHVVDSHMMDDIYSQDRNESSILRYITKVYSMTHQKILDVKKFRYLEYVKYSNADNTMLHGYQNGSSYYVHDDGAVLTFLYVFWDEPKPFTGGELIFTDYGYTPELKSNCCIIFPSYERHRVSEVNSDQEGIVRWAVNQRIFIRNN